MSTTLVNQNVPSRMFIDVITGGITNQEDRERVIVELGKNADLMQLGLDMHENMSSFMQMFGITFNEKNEIMIPTGDCEKDLKQLKNKIRGGNTQKGGFYEKGKPLPLYLEDQIPNLLFLRDDTYYYMCKIENTTENNGIVQLFNAQMAFMCDETRKFITKTVNDQDNENDRNKNIDDYMEGIDLTLQIPVIAKTRKKTTDMKKFDNIKFNADEKDKTTKGKVISYTEFDRNDNDNDNKSAKFTVTFDIITESITIVPSVPAVPETHFPGTGHKFGTPGQVENPSVLQVVQQEKRMREQSLPTACTAAAGGADKAACKSFEEESNSKQCKFAAPGDMLDDSNFIQYHNFNEQIRAQYVFTTSNMDTFITSEINNTDTVKHGWNNDVTTQFERAVARFQNDLALKDVLKRNRQIYVFLIMAVMILIILYTLFRVFSGVWGKLFTWMLSFSPLAQVVLFMAILGVLGFFRTPIIDIGERVIPFDWILGSVINTGISDTSRDQFIEDVKEIRTLITTVQIVTEENKKLIQDNIAKLTQGADGFGKMVSVSGGKKRKTIKIKKQTSYKRKHKLIQSKKKHRKRVVTNKKRGGGGDYWKDLFLYLRNLINCTIVKSDVNNTQEILYNFTQQLSDIKKPTKKQLKQLDPLLSLIELFNPLLLQSKGN